MSNNNDTVSETSKTTIDKAIENAHAVFQEYKQVKTAERILFLQNIAAEINAIKPLLIEVTQRETYLPTARLEGELLRTTNQINLFANLLQEGSWVKAVIDIKQDPPSDIRQMQIPLGVVAVFGASNFPYAFSVAGGDTIAALAAGCPVVYKSNPAHPQTSVMVAACIKKAAEKTGIPQHVFSIVYGASHQVGLHLVMHPLITAVAFTGSFNGGKALYDAAAKRKTPIPVYAEMGSVNPIFVLPEIMQQQATVVAEKIIASNLQGVGQFCTNPGLVILTEYAGTDNFVEASAALISKTNAGSMLTENIHQAYSSGVKKLAEKETLHLAAQGLSTVAPQAAVPHLFVTDAANFLTDENLQEEVFGPSSIFIKAADKAALFNIVNHLHGQLTATVWGTDNDLAEYATLIQLLEEKAGRLIINNVPTGVEVTAAMVHGGPFPATTYSGATSVGTGSIYRFTRPVCYQGFPQFLLPGALKNENPLKIWRLVNGSPSTENI